MEYVNFKGEIMSLEKLILLQINLIYFENLYQCEADSLIKYKHWKNIKEIKEIMSREIYQ